MAAVDLKFFQLFARGQPGAQSKSWKTWRCKFWRLWAQKTGQKLFKWPKLWEKTAKVTGCWTVVDYDFKSKWHVFGPPKCWQFEEFMHLDRASSRSSSSPSKKNAPWNHPFSKDHCDAFNPCEKSAAEAKWIQLFISWNLQAKCWKIQPQNHDGKPSFQAVMVLSKQWWCFLVWRSFWCLCCVRMFVPIVWKMEMLLWCGMF